MGFEEKTPLFSLLQTVVKAVELGWCMTHQHDTGCIVESAVTLIQRAVCVRLSPSMGFSTLAIPPTSNIVERLFSVARAVLCHERHRISPMMLGMILFLKVNSSSWDVATVEQCL
eukprot:jgi/Phyca11/18121/fgenesh1_pg.PHYCAscaffold_33_\